MKSGFVYVSYIGRYVTKIFVSDKGDIYQCDGTSLDLEGLKMILALHFKGYDIDFES